MKTLSTAGRQKVTEIAARYNLQPGTVQSLLNAVVQGNGTMAQFNLPELGGPGQWMKGGMTMIGDMFNTSLRGTVDKLCSELAELVTTAVFFESNDGPVGDTPAHEGAREHPGAPKGFFSEPSTSWPTIFGNPTSSGSQNNFRYAYFAAVHRLVIEDGGKRTIYDTKHHQITGVSQQQGGSNSYKFTSQEGVLDLTSLEKVSDPERQQQPTPEIRYDATDNADLRSQDKSPDDIILATIERLNVLFEKGQITEQEFTAKKKELLERL